MVHANAVDIESAGGVDRRCQGCGGPLGASNLTGYCTKTPECKKLGDRIKQAKYHAAHAEERCARTRLWWASLDDRGRERRRQQYRDALRTPRGLARQVLNRVRALGETDLTLDYLLSLYTGKCRYCQVGLVSGNGTSRIVSPSLDKIIPSAGYRVGNVQWLCMQCNRRKGDMTAADMEFLLRCQRAAEESLGENKEESS